MTSKTKIVLGSVALSLLAVAACAGAETSEGTERPSEDGGEASTPARDDAAVDAGSDAERDGEGPCAENGFCKTVLPGASEVGVAPLEFVSILVDPELGTLGATTPPGVDPGPSFILRYDGAAWVVHAQIDARITAFLGDRHGHAIAIAGNGTVVRFDKNGHTLSTPLPRCQGAWAGDGGDVFVLAGGDVHRGRIARAEHDGGEDGWPSEWSSSFDLRAIWGRGSDDVTISTYDWTSLGSIFFRRRKTGDTVDYERLGGRHQFPASYGVALANERFWLVTDGRRGDFGELTDGGVSWLDAGTVFPVDVYGSWGTGVDDLWTVGDFGRAYLRKNGAWSDQGMSLGRGLPHLDGLRVVTGDGEGGLWIAGRGVALRKEANR